MDVVVKVVIDQKEYDRLLDIEKKYNELAKSSAVKEHQNQSGLGDKCYCRKGPSLPLSQIIAENTEAHAVQPPIAGILPSITTSNEDTQKESGSLVPSSSQPQSTGTVDERDIGHRRKIYPWYYIGIPDDKT